MNIKMVTCMSKYFKYQYSINLDKISEEDFLALPKNLYGIIELMHYLHNDESPAYISTDPRTNKIRSFWCISNGRPHSLDGPAITNHQGLFYFIHGKEYTKEEYDEAIACYKEDPIAFKLRYC